jgi:hypothetical protein
MLVVSSIVLLITAFVIFQQQKFNSSTLLRSLTYSVALTVRQAQVYGTSVRGFTSSSGTTFGSGYGVYVSPTLSCATGSAGSCYYLFADPAGALSDGRRASNGAWPRLCHQQTLRAKRREFSHLYRQREPHLIAPYIFSQA